MDLTVYGRIYCIFINFFKWLIHDKELDSNSYYFKEKTLNILLILKSYAIIN